MTLSVAFPVNFSGLSTDRENHTTDVAPTGAVKAGSIVELKYCRSGDVINSQYIGPCWKAYSGDGRWGNRCGGKTRGRKSSGGCLRSTRGFLLGTSSHGLYGSNGGCFLDPSSHGLYGSTGDHLLGPSSGGLFHWYCCIRDSVLGKGYGCFSYRRTGDWSYLPLSVLVPKVPLWQSWLVYLAIEIGGNSMKVGERSSSNSGCGGADASIGFFPCSCWRLWTSSVLLLVRASILSPSFPIFASNRVPIWFMKAFAKVFAAAWL